MTHFIKLFFYAAVLFIAGCKQSDPNTYNSEKWNAGDQLHYHVVITDVDKLHDSIIKVGRAIYKADLTINDLGKINTITWNIRQLVRKPDSLLTHLELTLGDTLREEKTFTIIYNTDAAGRYLGIVNWPDIEKYVDAQWNKLYKINQEEYIKNKDYLQQLKKLSSNHSAIEASMTKDIMALHLIYGLPISETPVQSKEPMLGIKNQLLSTDLKIEILKNYGDYLHVRVTSKPDSTEIAEQVGSFVRQFVRDSTAIGINLKDTCIVNFNKLTSWPSQVEYWRTLVVGDRKKTVSISMKQVRD